MSLTVGLTYNLKTHCPWGRGEVEDEAADYDDPQTVEELAGALKSGGHRVVHLPYEAGLFDAINKARPDIVFNIAEGWGDRNRESIVPAFLEFLGIPYTGSDALTLGSGLDKNWAKRLVGLAGIPTPRWFSVPPGAGLPPQYAGLTFPMFVKPNAEGSSKGIRYTSKVSDRTELLRLVRWVHETYAEPALVEEYLPGREFSIGLVGNGHRLRTLPIVAVLPGKDVPAEALGDNPETEFIYSYEPKSANMEAAQCPAPISEDLESRIEDLAFRVWDAFECRDVARADFKLDATGEPHFLEINPLPCLSRETSFLALEGRAAGMTYGDLILTILDEALIRCGLAPDTETAAEACGGRWAEWRAASRIFQRSAGIGS